jgi:hypothetical protein
MPDTDRVYPELVEGMRCRVRFNRETRRIKTPYVGRGEVYSKEANILYLIDITRVINYSLFLLTGGI